MNGCCTIVFGVVLSSYVVSASAGFFFCFVCNFTRVGIVSYDKMFPQAIKHNWFV